MEFDRRSKGIFCNGCQGFVRANIKKFYLVVDNGCLVIYDSQSDLLTNHPGLAWVKILYFNACSKFTYDGQNNSGHYNSFIDGGYTRLVATHGGESDLVLHPIEDLAGGGQ